MSSKFNTLAKFILFGAGIFFVTETLVLKIWISTTILSKQKIIEFAKLAPTNLSHDPLTFFCAERQSFLWYDSQVCVDKVAIPKGCVEPIYTLSLLRPQSISKQVWTKIYSNFDVQTTRYIFDSIGLVTLDKDFNVCWNQKGYLHVR